MGGQRETLLETKPRAKTSGTIDIATVGKIRVHESGGEVHFHDDDNKLKVAVPAADFWQKWRLLQPNYPAESHDTVFMDLDNGTVLFLAMSLRHGPATAAAGPTPVKPCLSLRIVPILWDDESRPYRDLHKFVSAR